MRGNRENLIQKIGQKSLQALREEKGEGNRRSIRGDEIILRGLRLGAWSAAPWSVPGQKVLARQPPSELVSPWTVSLLQCCHRAPCRCGRLHQKPTLGRMSAFSTAFQPLVTYCQEGLPEGASKGRADPCPVIHGTAEVQDCGLRADG